MPTFEDYRRRIAQDVGGLFHASTVVSGTTATIVDTVFPIKTSLDVADVYSGKYLLRPDAVLASDRVRFVAEQGYDAVTGTLRPDNEWTNTPTTGEAYELHGIIEPWTTMLDLVNSALKRCFLVDELDVTPQATYRRHGLTIVAPWLRNPRWVRQVGVIRSGDVRDTFDPFDRPFRGSVELQGTVVYLNHPDSEYTSADGLLIRAIKPAYYHCRPTGGIFGAQYGLALNDDEAPSDEEWVAAGALIYFWERYGDVIGGGNEGDVKTSLAKAAAAFTALSMENFELPARNLVTPSPLRRWGAVPRY